MNQPLSRRVTVDSGLDLHLLEWGGERPELEHTVVLVHGFLDLAWGWEDLVLAGLAERFHVIAFDQRGHGDSDRIGPGGYYHFMDYVADLASLLERTGRQRVSLVGHSMGGTVVSYYAGAFPDRVARLALLEGVGPPEDSADLPERTRHWIRGWTAARSKSPRAYPDVAAAARRLQQQDAKLGAELALRLAERGTRELPDGSRTFKHDPLHLTRGPYPFRSSFARSFWERITCPVLLVEGSDSPFQYLEGREERLATFRDARTHVITGAGHMMQRHAPEALCRVLCEFLI
jgi:pimeloyl-ACP methyl ester carboxylesterase